MTRAELVHHVAWRMLHRDRPLIEGMYLWDYTEGSPHATWDAADPFIRSDYTRRAHWHLMEIEPILCSPDGCRVVIDGVPIAFDMEVRVGQCECPRHIELPPERLKNTNIRECQRCGGAT